MERTQTPQSTEQILSLCATFRQTQVAAAPRMIRIGCDPVGLAASHLCNMDDMVWQEMGIVSGSSLRSNPESIRRYVKIWKSLLPLFPKVSRKVFRGVEDQNHSSLSEVIATGTLSSR